MAEETRESTAGLKEALALLNTYSNNVDSTTKDMPFFCATNALIMEIARREGTDIKTAVESIPKQMRGEDDADALEGEGRR